MTYLLRSDVCEKGDDQVLTGDSFASTCRLDRLDKGLEGVDARWGTFLRLKVAVGATRYLLGVDVVTCRR